MVLEFFNKTVGESELAVKLKTKPFGTHIITILSMNQIYGIKAKIEFWSLEELKAHLAKFKTPVITLVWTEYLAHWIHGCLHSVVVVGFDNEHVIINDPNFDEKDFYIPFEDFINAWQANDGLAAIFFK